jgi:hypothetical protein
MTAMGATRSPEHGGRDADGWTVGRAPRLRAHPCAADRPSNGALGWAPAMHSKSRPTARVVQGEALHMAQQPSASLHIAPGRPHRTTGSGLTPHNCARIGRALTLFCASRGAAAMCRSAQLLRTHASPKRRRSAPAAVRTGRPTELRAPGMGTGGDAGKGHGGHGRTVADVQASDQRHIRGPFIPAPAGRAARYCPGQCHTATGQVHVRLPAEECTCSAKEKTQTRGKATALHCAEAFENMAPPRVAIALKARARVYSSSSSCRIDSCTPSACPKGRR